MSNLTKLEFVALDITDNNYLSWILDAQIHLDVMGLGDTIKDGNQESQQNRAKAMIFLRRHLHEGLKLEYLTIKDPLVLWNSLKERYDHHKSVILPKARFEWMHLQFQDFKIVRDYNSTMFRITSKLKLCGETVMDHDMLEKTYSTFHVSNMLLQQQYREKGFKKYSELISCLLVAEQNNELLLKNHETRPTGSAPLPEVNETIHNNVGRGRGRGRNIYRGRGRGYGKNFRGRHSNNFASSHQKWYNLEQKKDNGSQKQYENKCFRCGMAGHWSRTCRTPRHLADLYKESLKKDQNIGANLVENDPFGDNHVGHGTFDATHLDVSDFFEDPEGKIDHLIGDDNVNTN